MGGINDNEYGIFSQNGEDGVIDYLARGLRANNRKFVELGTSDGQENNSFYLLKKGWSGLGVDADAELIKRYAQRASQHGLADRVELAAGRVNARNCIAVLERAEHA